MIRAGLGLALAAALAGCGGGGNGGDGGLSREALAEDASAICMRFSEQTADLGRLDASDPASGREYFEQARDLSQRQEDALAELDPGEDVQEDFQALLDASADGTRLLGRLAELYRENDPEGAITVLSELEPVSDAVDAAANAIGAQECASP